MGIETPATTPNKGDDSSLWALRVWYFLYFGAQCADLYLPLLLSETMQFAPPKIGVLQAMRRILRFLFSPVLCYVMDRTRAHRLLIVLLMFGYYGASASLTSGGGFLAVAFILFIRDGSNAPIAATVDAAATATLAQHNEGREHKAIYGRLRLFGSLGWGSICFFNGLLVDNIFDGDMRVPLFIQAGIGVLVTLMSAKGIDLSPTLFQRDEQRRMLQRLDRSAENHVLSADWIMRVVMFVSNVIMISFCLGMQSTSLYLYMSSLGVPNTVLGLSTAMNCAVEAVVFLFYGSIVRRIGGHEAAFNLSAFVNSVVVFVIANCHRATNPTVPFLMVQLLVGITFALFWGSSVYISADLAPVGRETSAQGVLNAISWGLGASLGDIIAGVALQSIGAPMLYSLASASQFFVLFVPWLIWNLMKRARRRNFRYTIIHT